MDDKVLRQTIIDALDREPSVNAAHIGVAVENGVATLTGHLGSHAEQAAAEEAVQCVRGVRAIVQDIEIRDPRNRKTCDHDIAKRALVVIAWHAATPEDAVTVHVQKGWVTLTGTVEDAYQRAAAEVAVRKLDGVVGVSNLIEIRAPAPDAQRPFEGTVDRHPEIEADAIRVTVENDPRIVMYLTSAALSGGPLARPRAWLKAVEDRIALVCNQVQ
jgi:hypothetical protein